MGSLVCVCVYVCRYLPGRYVRYALGMGAWMALSGPINAFSCRCSSSELRAASSSSSSSTHDVQFRNVYLQVE